MTVSGAIYSTFLILLRLSTQNLPISNCNALLTALTCIYDTVEAFDFDQEVVFEKDESDDGEEINENDGENRRQQDGATVFCHRPYDVEQRLLPVDDVQQLSNK